jgi:2-aminobenzoate-CoA ligase
MFLPAAFPSAHQDRFAPDRLPDRHFWPTMDFADIPVLRDYPNRLNAAAELLDAMATGPAGARPCIHFGGRTITYAALKAMADRIAHVLVGDYGLVTGNRVLLRGPNNPMMVACWFAVLKAGGIAVATMPLLRARELSTIAERAEIGLALCDTRLAAELEGARERGGRLARIGWFTPFGDGADMEADLDQRMGYYDQPFATVDTAADDIALIAFTSGTTGAPKGTMHCHRDVLAITDLFPRSTFGLDPEEIVCGSPPLAFTFGLGALTLFPMRAGAQTVLAEQFDPEKLLTTIASHRVTALYTAPTAYRAMLDLAPSFDLSSLRKCVSAGEHLPKATDEAWFKTTGIRIMDGLGATEMLHIFVSSNDPARPFGATGKAIPGYQAQIVGPDGAPLPDGTPGRLAVRGPTGCRYLDDPERQKAYVQNGWNLTGDVYLRDAEGWFWYQARADDMIISSGYNIAGPEIEGVLLDHPAVRECAVIGAPDPERGQIVKAYVVLRQPENAGAEMVKTLQDHVKRELAPYKYPRAIEFVDALPRSEVGKLQRFRLRAPAKE